MKYSYVIIDDNPKSIASTRAVAARFPELVLVGVAHNLDDGLNQILEHTPELVFLEIDPEEKDSNLSLSLVSELHRYFIKIPRIIITTTNKDLVFQACRYDILDYFLKPFDTNDLRKTLLRFKKLATEQKGAEKDIFGNGVEKLLEVPIVVATPDVEELVETEEQAPDDDEPAQVKSIEAEHHSQHKPLIICVKSYGDYRFIEAKDICYLQADNNSTDIHLNNGEMITAFKTLKHFEGVLSTPFVRIHNSYIVNIDYVSRIHTGNAVCYIKNTTTKLPFSKSYKENVDAIISRITTGNYLEI